MTDFVKVNFKNGEIANVHKSTLKLKKYCRYKDGKRYFQYHCYTIHWFLENIFECFFRAKANLDEAEYQSMYSEARITKEEYGRLCKVLGVEN